MENSSKDDSATDGGDTPSNSGLYAVGEKVLAYHGPRIYEAKVQKIETRQNEWKYFVHYQGWNKNWDEWVGEDRLMKNTEKNVTKQQTFDKKQGVDKISKYGHSAQAKAKGSMVSKGKKPRNDSGVEGSVLVEKLVKIQIPATLKKQLVDDWEFVTQQDKLVKLPRTPTVDEILTKYLEHSSKKDGMVADSLENFLKGIRCYFDKSLPVMLLYNKEGKQYKEAVLDNVSPSTILYGAEHLLRLFVKLPEVLAYVNVEEEMLNHMQQKLIDFLKFLQKNQSTFFVSAYDGSNV